MSQSATMHGASAPDRLARLIQKRVFGDRVNIPLEVRLWGGRTYRFGAGEPAVKILVKDRKGLSALRRLNELRICEAYMNGSLDVQGDILRFASLRPGFHDRRPVHDLWRRLTPWLVGRITTDRHAIAAHYDFASDFYLRFLDPTRCYSQAVLERDDEPPIGCVQGLPALRGHRHRHLHQGGAYVRLRTDSQRHCAHKDSVAMVPLDCAR